jgi:hypothetical protein
MINKGAKSTIPTSASTISTILFKFIPIGADDFIGADLATPTSSAKLFIAALQKPPLKKVLRFIHFIVVILLFFISLVGVAQKTQAPFVSKFY